MAIYEYFCEKCNSKFQVTLPIGKAKEKTECPSCKSLSQRIYSNFLFFSKGERNLSSKTPSKCDACITRSCSSCI